METRYGVGKLKVPQGFAGLLERFAREVLRKQPLDIAEFGAQYFQEQLRKRDDTGFDPLVHDVDVENRKYNDVYFGTKGEYPLRTPNKEEYAAVKIQAGYRGYKDRKKVVHLKEEQELEHAAVKIQANFKGFKTRKEMKKKQEEKAHHKEELVEQTEENVTAGSYTTEDIAATKIQSTFRGHKIRKNIQSEREQNAATKIQAQFRGHQTRKHITNATSEKETVNRKEEYNVEAVEEEERTVADVKEDEVMAEGVVNSEEYKKKNEEEILPGPTEEDVKKNDYETKNEEVKVEVIQDQMLLPEKYAMQEEEEIEQGEEDKKNTEDEDLKPEEATQPDVAQDENLETDKMDVKSTNEKSDNYGDVADAGDAQIQVNKALPVEDKEKLYEAAVCIQAHYRGYCTRKALPQKQYTDQREKSGDAV